MGSKVAKETRTKLDISKKENSQDREIVRLNKSYDRINNSSSKLFYSSIICLNILTLFVCVFYLNSKQKIEDINMVLSGFDYNLLILLSVMFVAVIILKALPLYLRIYSKVKNRRFGYVLGATVAGEFFGKVTIYGLGENSVVTKNLQNKSVSPNLSIDVKYGANVFRNLSQLIFWFVTIVLGLIFCINSIKSWLVVIGLISFIVIFSSTIFVFVFKANKKFGIDVVSKFVKVLYNLGLTKNYEETYNKMLDKVIVSANGIRQDGWLTFVEIFSGLLCEFLKGAMIYFLVVTLNLAESTIIFEILFKFSIMQLIFKLWPLQSGTLIFELLFVTLFENIFFSGYVFWGLIIYRFFDLFAYAIVYLIQVVIKSILNTKSKKSTKTN